MPELPEVETTRRGIAPHIIGRRVAEVIVRKARLRWPVAAGLRREWVGQKVEVVERRAKYLLLRSPAGTAIVHLGMTGSLRILRQQMPPTLHDHIDVCFESGPVLRFTDPRRFGAWLWTRREPLRHPLLAKLGPEPLSTDFDGLWLHHLADGRKVAVKNFLMDAKVVVGVGNIYASEALYRAGIHPARAAGRVSVQRYRRLAEDVKAVLAEAIKQGGTTLRNFVSGEGVGEPGYFAVQLNVYGREGRSCPACGQAIRRRVIGQRSSFFCARCQR